MKKSKRILSLLTALTITASAFASLVIPASAASETVYTMNLTAATSGRVTAKMAGNDKSTIAGTNASVVKSQVTAPTAELIAACSVEDFGTGNSDATYGVPAVAALDGWGYHHFANSGLASDKDREASASVDATNNAFYINGVGNADYDAAISFIPANANITLGSNIYYYTFDAIVTGGGNATRGIKIPRIGFTSAENGATITDVAHADVPSVEGAVTTYKMVLVYNKDTGAYIIYRDGVQQAAGTSADITGIYAQSTEKYTNVGVKDLVLTKEDAVPATIDSVTWKSGSETVATYENVIVGATLKAPADPTPAQGEVFTGWAAEGTDTVLTTFTAGSADTVFEAVFEDRTTITQDYEASNAAVDWTDGSNAAGRYIPTIKEENGNHYLSIDAKDGGDNGTSGLVTNSNFKTTIEADTNFFFSFKMGIAGGDNDQTATFSIKDASGGNLLTLRQISGGGTEYRINEYAIQTVTLEKSAWYTVELARKDDLTFLAIKDADGADVFAQAPIWALSANGGISGMAFTTGRYNAALKFDDFVLRNLASDDVPSTVYTTLTVNTERYATIKYKINDGAEATQYADVKGVITIPNIPKDSVVTYTLSKKGYTDVEGTATMSDDLEQTKTMTILPSETEEQYIYVETDFGNASGEAGSVIAADRSVETALGDVEIPAMATVSIDWYVEKAERNQITWILKNKAGKTIIGLQGTASDGALKVFTGYNGSAAMNSDGDAGKYTTATAKTIAESYIGDKTIDFVIDRNTGNITVKCGDVTESIPIESGVDASVISSMKMGKATNYTKAVIKEIRISEPNPNYINVSGDTGVARVKGKEVKRTYTASPAVLIPEETFTWSVKDESGNAPTGVTINAETGELTISDTAVPGKVTVTAVGSSAETKTGSLDVTIGDFQKFTLDIDGPKAYDVTDTEGQYTVNSIKDTLNDDLNGVVDVVWTSSNTGVATIDASTGKLTVVAAGETTITATVTNDTQVSEATIPAKVAKYYITEDATDDTTQVDITGLVSDGVKEYLVTTADASGNVISQTKKSISDFAKSKATKLVAPKAAVKLTATYTDGKLVSVATPVNVAADEEVNIPAATETTKVFLWDSLSSMEPVTPVSKVVDTVGGMVDIATEGAAKLEIAPIYETTMNQTLAVPADTYNITATVNNGRHADLYVNDQMVMNNINQGSDNYTIGRIVPATASYDTEDIVIPEGYARFNYRDDSSGGSLITKVTFSKAPSIVTRAKRVYVIGDSLTAIYYGDAPEGNLDGLGGWKQSGLVRTGWGQVLQDYISGAKVTDLGNSGAWASGMYNDAFTQVRESAQPGDIVIWESGYNDQNHSTETAMNTAITKAVNECKEMGVLIYLVTPNASAHDYSGSVVWSSKIRDIAKATEAPLIDLSADSYAFLNNRYGALSAEDRTKNLVGLYTDKDNDGKFNKDVDEITFYGLYSNLADTLHSTYNAANVWAAIVAEGLLADDDVKDIVNTTYEYKFSDYIGEITVMAGTMVPAAADDGE